MYFKYGIKLDRMYQVVILWTIVDNIMLYKSYHLYI